MAGFLILNGHQPYPFAPGRLNTAFAERAAELLAGAGHLVRITTVHAGYEVEEEVAKHQWADTIILQFPVNWMGVPWSFKKYMDEVYTAGMDGRMCDGDGRSAEAPTEGYGMGGRLTDTSYMISATLNAPEAAFNDAGQSYFEGISLDELLKPVHLNAKFFGMTALPSFAAYDVMKNPKVEDDFDRFDAHVRRLFFTNEGSSHVAA